MNEVDEDKLDPDVKRHGMNHFFLFFLEISEKCQLWFVVANRFSFFTHCLIVAREDTKIYDKGEFYEGEDNDDKGKFADAERNISTGASMIQSINSEIRTEMQTEVATTNQVNNPEITMEGNDD